MVDDNSSKSVNFVCPKCNARKQMMLPTNLLGKHEINLATIVVNGDCGHNYIAYLDSHLAVRSYQYTDLFFMSELQKIDQELSDIYGGKVPESTADKKIHSKIFDEIDRKSFQQKAIEFYTVAQLYKPVEEPIQLNQELIDELKSASLQLIAESKEDGDLPSTTEIKPAVEKEGEFNEEQIKCDYTERHRKIEKYLLDLEYDYVEGDIEQEVFLVRKARLLQLEKRLEKFYNQLVISEIREKMKPLIEENAFSV
ncbi:MAG: hypothetical protein ACFFCS_23345 [Candidatus Hodarchaeota archaeon]